ncbi:hypothetical protein CBS147311_8115 [Penicillium roqueforti]|nr:hypothetical protein CBS147311_8115 [Penicillium roqueforti]
MGKIIKRIPYKGVLIELKNIVLHSSMQNIELPTNTLKSILYCGATVEYQCGRITEEQYFARLASDFRHPQEEIKKAILAVRKSLCVNPKVVEALASMKAKSKGLFELYAVTNFSKEDYALVKFLGFDWSLFERVFVSSDIGMQKPELRFYQHVLNQIGLSSEQVILVDDDTSNLLAAMSMGMQGVMPSDYSLYRSILNFVDIDPIGRGTRYLHENAQKHHSFTHTGVPEKENFTQLLILELTGDRSLIDIGSHRTTWNLFIVTPVLTQADFPDDMDTTSLGITILNRPTHVANLVMDKMLQYRTSDGLMQTFFTDFKKRVDPIVCCNILNIFYQYGWGNELSETFDWVYQVLQTRTYIHGSAFYPLPEAFFFFLSRMMLRLKNHRPCVYIRMRGLLIKRLEERLSVPVDAASLAMRLIVCHQVGETEVLLLHSRLMPFVAVSPG